MSVRENRVNGSLVKSERASELRLERETEKLVAKEGALGRWPMMGPNLRASSTRDKHAHRLHDGGISQYQGQDSWLRHDSASDTECKSQISPFSSKSGADKGASTRREEGLAAIKLYFLEKGAKRARTESGPPPCHEGHGPATSERPADLVGLACT